MSDNQPWTFRELVFASMAVCFVLFVNGAMPFLMLPTLEQAIWSMGFAQSFANGPLLDLYARDFGIPEPAAMAFGLAGAWPASLLIRLGLHPADAYTGVVALWLGLAMFSAYQITRRFKATRSIALLGAVAWITMPIIWAHAGYSMLSLGIALLSFYFLAAFRLFLIESESTRVSAAAIVTYFAAAIVSVFMDGYSFMMFACGSSILLLYLYITRPQIRSTLLKIAMPTHVASFALAYVLFSVYIGKSNFETHPMDFFRGWGLDLSFVALPTKGVLWLPDFLGLSLNRTDELYFGDASVWKTTFSLPVLLLGFLAWWRAKRHIKLATGVLFIAIFGFYMALGPSLKINSTKPESLQSSHPRQQSALMPADLAVAPTGNAWISEKLPGFNVMRASYRWSALGIFALWLLAMIWVACTNKGRSIWLLALVVLILLNLPDFQKRWQKAVDARDVFEQIELDLVAELRQHIQPAETVLFIPWGNDFVVNYLAPKAGFRAFNIGGDKNLNAALLHWPPEILSAARSLDADKAVAAIKMLIDGSADALVLPYFYTPWSLGTWPCVNQMALTVQQREGMHSASGFICPADHRVKLQPVFRALRELPYIDITESRLFATVRLRSEWSGAADRAALLAALFQNIEYPIEIGTDFKKSAYLLRKGWHALEEHHAWSQATARLLLPVPENCETKDCDIVLNFTVFGASSQRPVSVLFESLEQQWQWSEKIEAFSGDVMAVRVPLAGAELTRELSIFVPDATSPLKLTGSPDSRVLGIALRRVELLHQDPEA